MNDELIKRIDRVLESAQAGHIFASVLHECRAALSQQDAENESLRNQNTALDAKLAEYSERKYVPMTDDEVEQLPIYWLLEDQSVSVRKVEAEVIRRAGLEVAGAEPKQESQPYDSGTGV